MASKTMTTTLKNMKKDKKYKKLKNKNVKNTKNIQTLDEKLGDRNDITIKRLVRRLERASDAYYNGTVPILSDQQYDYMLDKLKQLDPENKLLKKVGSTPPDDQKITLPTQMGSLEKSRPSGINEWLRKLDKNCTLVITPKLDGFSGLLHYRNGKLLAVYTRGDGVVGRSVTNKAKNVNGVVTHDFAPKGAKSATKTDKCFHIKGDVFVKGEFVIHDTIFNKYYKGKGGYRNARNFVVGMINRQGKDEYVTKALKRMSFVSYSLECPNEKRIQGLDKNDQLAMLRQLGFITIDRPWLPRSKKKEAKLEKLYAEKYQNLSGFVGHKKHRKSQRSKDQRKESRKIQDEIDKLSGKPYSGQVLPINVSDPSSVDGYTLRKYIQFMQLNCDIQQDGLVIEVNEHKVAKKMGYEANGLNPVWARSIKLEQEDQQSKIGKVQNISWNYTKRSILKPTVVLKEPLSFKGVEVTNVFAHNAKYVKDNGIDKNAKIKVIRSGDVIPYILDVSKSVKTDVPKNCPYCDHKLKWSSVDIYCENKKCEGKNYTRLINFFSTIGIDEIGSGTIDQLWSAGYTSVKQLLRADSKKLKKIEGFASKKADTVAKGLKNSVNGIGLAKLMHASGYFSTEISGLGEIRLQSIIDELGTKQILNYDNVIRKKKKMVRKIADIEGLSEKSADIFVSNLPDFIKFYRTIEDKVVLKDNKKSKGKLKNMKFCFTGFRDKHLQSQIEDNGGKLTNSVNKDLDILFAKDQNTTKAKQARSKGVQIVDMQNARSKVQELLS